MNRVLGIILLVIVVFIGYTLLSDTTATAPTIEDGSAVGTEQAGNTDDNADTDTMDGTVSVVPISHATMVLNWGETVVYVDPVGGAEAFVGQPQPAIILMTDIHGDHLSIETLEAVTTDNTTIIAPQAVADELTEELNAQTTIMGNGEQLQVLGLNIESIPMYNLPDQGVEIRHEKGRGNGYLLEAQGERVYIAGDTADIPEMRSLEDIDIAFVPMNLPYTMSVGAAADAVIEFAPERVYPYHYRTPEGFSDIDEFEQLVNEGNSDVEVVLLDWYPEQS